jgi:DNA recombination protein RmuC
MSEHFVKMGSAIERTVETYNQTVASLEKTVLPSARRFRELRPANAAQLEEVTPIEAGAKTLDPAKWKILEAKSG